MNDEIEQRLRDYGATIDTATRLDLTERDSVAVVRSAQPKTAGRRRTTMALSLLGVAAVAVFVVVFLGPRDGHVRITGSVPTTTSPSTRPVCDPNSGDSAACPEEGPPLTPEQKAQFAQWRREYNPADVARITKGHPGQFDDVMIVETMEGDIGCAVTRTAWKAAKRATPERRAAAVDEIMRGELVRLTERNWPAQSQMPEIFRRITEQLETGDLTTFDSLRSLFEGECGHATVVHP